MPPKLLPIYSKDLVRFLRCTYIAPVNIWCKCITQLILAQISAEGLNHYTIVYGLNSTKQTKKVVGHQSVYWKTVEDHLSDLCAFDAGYKIANGYSKTNFTAPGAPAVNEVIFKEPGPCFRCGVPHFQNRCMKVKVKTLIWYSPILNLVGIWWYFTA